MPVALLRFRVSLVREDGKEVQEAPGDYGPEVAEGAVCSRDCRQVHVAGA